MLLGAILKEVQDEDAAAAALLSLGDIVLLAEVEAARLPHKEGVGEYVSGATQRFARLASDEDWLRLMTLLEKSPSPAATCVTTMVRWSIVRDTAAEAMPQSGGCSCHP
ncbi:MAG: hypothetical protein ACKVP7_20370 [Hyphomicrobiaceae bacterium]